MNEWMFVFSALFVFSTVIAKAEIPIIEPELHIEAQEALPAWQRRASTCGRALLPHADKHMFICVLELCKSEAKRAANGSSTLPRRTRPYVSVRESYAGRYNTHQGFNSPGLPLKTNIFG
jgi:hypothetical protein